MTPEHWKCLSAVITYRTALERIMRAPDASGLTLSVIAEQALQSIQDSDKTHQQRLLKGADGDAGNNLQGVPDLAVPGGSPQPAPVVSGAVTSKDHAPIGAAVEGELRKQPSDRASPAGALGGPASPSSTQTVSHRPEVLEALECLEEIAVGTYCTACSCACHKAANTAAEKLRASLSAAPTVDRDGWCSKHKRYCHECEQGAPADSLEKAAAYVKQEMASAKKCCGECESKFIQSTQYHVEKAFIMGAASTRPVVSPDKYDAFKAAYAMFPSQDSEGYVPNRGDFKTGFLMGWEARGNDAK